MSIITVDNASLAFGHYQLLSSISFGIEKNDKIGLIGRNGAGKSSLLKAIAKVIDLDDGKISYSTGLKVVYVAQEPILQNENTIFEEVFSSLGEIQNSLIAYNHYLDQLTNNYSEETLEKLSELQLNLEHNGGFKIKSLIDKTLSELELDGCQIISNLSGGVKKKVAIAKALVANPDVILLDEPTNHLDISAVLWLENVITNFNGAVVLITHDRYFLDKTVNKIIELDRGNLKEYPGSYSKYQEWKNQQLADEEKNNKEFDKFLAQEEIWIRKGIEARRTRNEGRVKRLEELRKLRIERRERVGNTNFIVDRGSASGKIVAKLEHINLSFDSHPVIEDFSATVMRGDKIGLIGANGIGKSSLLKVVLGQIPTDSGIVTLGTKLKVAYFDQFREQLDEESTIQDVINQGQDYVEVNGRRMHIATYLEDFLFAPSRFRAQVKSLSGGERNRLLLARLFSKPANVLVLDEPTNDLDMETLELLEELLVNYTGTVFLVSHDRVFLDNVVTQSYIFLGSGKIFEFAGGYSDWIQYKNSNPDALIKSVDNVIKNDTKLNKTDENFMGKEYKTVSEKKHIKLSYKERIELESLPDLLMELEEKRTYLDNKLLDPELYKGEIELVKTYQKQLTEVNQEISEKMERWEELERKKLFL